MTSALEADIRFQKNDLHTVGTTNRGCLVVYPVGRKSRQKVAIGDSTGLATVFSFGKHHDLQVQFQTSKSPKPISRLTLYQEQLFLASGSRIDAYSKKGKPFFGFETNMTEVIRSLNINTPHIVAGGDYVLTSFQEMNELGFYMCPDKINDTLSCTYDENGQDVFVACQDRCFRIVRDHTKLHAEFGCESPLYALCLTAPEVKDPSKRDILYGTMGGSVGCFSLGARNEITRKYSAIPRARLGSITAVCSSDVNSDGVADVVVGRDDGSVEVHLMGMNTDGSPSCAWSSNLKESITSVATGLITNVERDEIIVSTFSGKIVSYNYHVEDAKVQMVVPMKLQGAAGQLPSSIVAPSSSVTTTDEPQKGEILNMKVKEVEYEVSKLQQTLQERRREFLEAQTQSLKKKQGSTGGGVLVQGMAAVTSEFRVLDKLALDNGANMVLRIEVDCTLDMVALECDVAMDFVDIPSGLLPWRALGGGDDGPNSSSSSDQKQSRGGVITSINNKGCGGSKVLGVLRPVEKSNLVEVRFRSTEGQSGTLRAFIIPRAEPRTAQLRLYKIRPLGLHQRVSEQEVQWETLPLSILRINGIFTAKDMHSWIYQVLPDVPEVLQSDSALLCYKNSLLGTALSIRYTKGEAEFRSENISTLATLKEWVAREATTRKIIVKMESEPRRDSIIRTMTLLHPLIFEQSQLVSQHRITEALKEIETQEHEISFLSSDLSDVIQRAPEIEREILLQPGRVEYLRALMKKLYADQCMFKGEVVVQAKINQLDGLLNNYNIQQVTDFFLV